jgi:ribonuclease D
MTDDTAQPELSVLLKPRVSDVRLIETEADLAIATKILSAGSGLFAIDAERASGFKYSQRAYLIQVHRRSGPIFLIDPAALAPDTKMAREVFEDLGAVLQTAPWILHSASQDLPCLKELGIECPELFDTELGSRIAGFERVGLGAVCAALLNMQLAKEHSAVDWSIRPLHDDWLNYAAIDVDVLPDLHDALHADLVAQGKIDWARQEFAFTLEMKKRSPKIDRWRSLTGMQNVKSERGLAIARELWTAREELGEKLDVSPGRLVPDSSIVAVAANPPRTRPEFVSFKSFNGRASRTYADVWWAATERGSNTRDLPALKVPAIGIPNHRNWPQRYPEAAARLAACKEVVAAKSKEINIPAENLLKPDTMRALCFDPPSPVTLENVIASLLDLEARHWQIENLAPGFVNGLQAQPATEEEPPLESSDPEPLH